ncbi:MAG: hypothetical protein HQL99_12425 [Magnetococcales bacterium]|nr:hypothetical protein [Magnetococcales bacterium]
MLDNDLIQLKLLVQESKKRLSTSLPEVQSLALADKEACSSILDYLLRTIRGIGGSAIFHDLTPVVLLSQSMETLINRMRERSVFVQPESIQVLVTSLKKLQHLLEDVTQYETISIDSELVAIQAILAVYSDPPQFDLRHHPQAVSQAVVQGLNFFSVNIPLDGDPAANRKKFHEVKDAIQVVGTLVATIPDLGQRFEWHDGIRVGLVRVLVSTVLQQDLLLGLTQLPADRIVLLPIPEEMKKIELVELSDPAEEEPETDAPTEPDDYEEGQLGDVEDRIRQSHLDEMKKQRQEQEQKVAREAQEREEKQRQTQIQHLEIQRKRRRFQTMVGMSAGGVLVAAAVWLVLGRSTQPTPPASATRPQVTTVAKVSDPGPRPPVQAAESKSAIPAPVNPPVTTPVNVPSAAPEPVRPPTEAHPSTTTAPAITPTVTPTIISATAPTPQPAAAPQTGSGSQSSAPEAKPTSSTVAPRPETGTAPVASPLPESSPAKETVASAADSKAPSSQKSKPATEEQADRKADNDAPFQVRFAKHHTTINRLLQTPYLKIKPAKGTVQGGLTYARNKEGDVLFSIAPMMGHTASRPEEQFTIGPDSISEIRIVFQIERGAAYLFEFDRDGTVVVPAAFWDPFSKSSKKGVSISRVIKQAPEGVHLRDISAVSIAYIARTIGTK